MHRSQRIWSSSSHSSKLHSTCASQDPSWVGWPNYLAKCGAVKSDRKDFSSLWHFLSPQARWTVVNMSYINCTLSNVQQSLVTLMMNNVTIKPEVGGPGLGNEQTLTTTSPGPPVDPALCPSEDSCVRGHCPLHPCSTARGHLSVVQILKLLSLKVWLKGLQGIQRAFLGTPLPGPEETCSRELFALSSSSFIPVVGRWQDVRYCLC